MSIVWHEMRKIWNLRILLIIALLCAGFWFGGLREGVRSFDSLTRHGRFGVYQGLMFEMFGDTLEPHELAAFDIPGRIAAVEVELDAMDESVEAHDGTLEGWFATPYMRYMHLRALEWRYANYYAWLETIIEHDSRPVVVQSARRVLEMSNNSLIDNDLTRYFSLYSAVVGVLAVVAAAVLVTPLVVLDRGRKINYLQYSSKIGRKILKAQFAAVVLSAFALSAVITALAYIPFLLLSRQFWNASILANCGELWLYDITFGQYVILTALLIIILAVAAVCVVFILSRFSQEILAAMFKIVPAVAAFSAIAVICINMMFSASNIIFTQVFRGRVVAPEIIVCAALGLLAVLAAAVVAQREKGVELL